MTELARIVAAVFRRLGKGEASRNEFKQTLSFRLNWYAPAQASQILERALEAGLLQPVGEVLRPSFDPSTVELPMDFRGSALALEEPIATAGAGAPAAAPMVPAAPAPLIPTPEPDAALAERARALRLLSRGALDEDTALLLALRERNLDVRERAAEHLRLLAPARAGP